MSSLLGLFSTLLGKHATATQNHPVERPANTGIDRHQRHPCPVNEVPRPYIDELCDTNCPSDDCPNKTAGKNAACFLIHCPSSENVPYARRREELCILLSASGRSAMLKYQ